MKTTLKLSALLFTTFLSFSLAAQNNNGGFGFFQGGISSPLSNTIQTRLQEPGLFGSKFGFNSPGLHFGGRGFGWYNRFIVGGGGYGNTIMGSTENGEVTLGMGAGFFDFGYMLMKKQNTYAYVFGGIGGGGSTLQVKNTGPITLSFAQNQQIPTGENRKVSTGGFGFEAGIGISQLIMAKEDADGRGGLMIGLIAGINYFPSKTWKFETNETTVTNMGGNLSSFYVGITIGGGGTDND